MSSLVMLTSLSSWWLWWQCRRWRCRATIVNWSTTNTTFIYFLWKSYSVYNTHITYSDGLADSFAVNGEFAAVHTSQCTI